MLVWTAPPPPPCQHRFWGLPYSQCLRNFSFLRHPPTPGFPGEGTVLDENTGGQLFFLDQDKCDLQEP